MTGVTVLGIDELNRVVATFTDKTNGMDSRTALVVRKAAFDVERFAKEIVPVDTGFLRSSIVTEIFGNSMRVYGAEVRAEASYAGWVEGGTSRMAPQPFMGPAYERVLPGFTKAMEFLADPLSKAGP